MPFEFKKPKKSINPAFFKQPVPQNEIERLKKALSVYLSSGKPDESEEFHKNLIKKFLEETFYSPDYAVNTNGREDLVIFGGNTANSKPAVIIEAKSPSNSAEMFSENNYNCKALQECVYYFLQENLKFQNNEIKHIIITNYYDFYIFDAAYFARFFLVKTNPIIDQFLKFEAKQLSDTKTSYFYEKCAKPAIEKWIENENIVVTKVTPAEFYRHSERQSPEESRCRLIEISESRNVEISTKKEAATTKTTSDETLVPLYKIFSPEHLLGKPFANDSNSLDKNFYEELLHIVGLEEVKESGKKVIRRKKEAERDGASLLESAIYQLEEENLDENGRYEVALRLAINWINRLIFLKLVESQQLAYRKGDEKYRFLTTELVPDFDSLNILFFKVLGRRPEARDSEVKEKFRFVPYLNSSLFEPSVEEKLLQIRGIMNKPMKLFPRTVLKDEKGRKMTGKMDNLAYIFRFLDAYNFSSETESGITQDTKTLINASVLGLIFEKINGYKDGSFFTPGFITEYMAKETVERTVIQKFNDFKGWKCETLEELADKIDDRAEANEIINSIRICDPAVGSGHFLVSVLNRLLFIKSYLDILLDRNGRRIRRSDWAIELENDEISILDDEGNPFVYSINPERQRVQEAIFNEKRTIIENCLFGVDINPASVYICRLRLWIELLKNAYYTEESGFTQLETLPNIDINIKCGNSLVSRYSIKTGSSVLSEGNPDTRKLIKQYREAVATYKNENNKENKRKVDSLIQSIKRQIHGVAQLTVFDEAANQKILDDDIYADSLEWMIEFPEVLADTGKFLGFDAVIGNPPYGVNLSEKAKLFYREKYEVAKTVKGMQKGTTDTFALFINLGLNLLNKNGRLSFIVPMSVISSDSMTGVHKLILNNCQTVYVSSYAVRPEPVFQNAVVNTSIIFLKKTLTKCEHLFSTKMYRKRRGDSDLDNILKHLSFVDVIDLLFNGRIPKIGTEIEKSILEKLLKHQKLAVFIKEKGTPIYYRTTGGRYFKVVTDYPTGSTKEKPLYFSKEFAKIAGCLLSSNLSFWFYQILSNNNDWKQYEIENFRIPLNNLEDNTLKQLAFLYDEYLNDIEKNAVVRQSSGESKYKVAEFREYKISRSKSLIDKIDDIICPLYGLTKEETDFIKNYEIKFRVDDDE